MIRAWTPIGSWRMSQDEVRTIVSRAIRETIEECAKVADQVAKDRETWVDGGYSHMAAEAAAKAIRKLGEG